MGRDRPGRVLTLAGVAVVLAAAFGVVTAQVVGHDGLARLDPDVASFAAEHRFGWGTPSAEGVSWLGSSFVLIPLIVVVGGYFVVRRRDWSPLIRLSVSLAGAIALYNLGKLMVDRPRPPERLRVGSVVPGGSFPSGHAAEALAVWGMMALLAAVLVTRRRWIPVLSAALIVLLVGASRVYLDAHWLTDVLAGYAAGGFWLSAVLAVIMWRDRRRLASRRRRE
jgi:membrane-associated phospholipid phosphatase